MAIRESQDRRVGLYPEKLLTLEEAARQLDISVEEVEGFIEAKRLPSFRLAGNWVRVRWKDVEALQRELKSKKGPAHPEAGSLDAQAGGIPSFKAQGIPSIWERLIDFFYFNDFYLVTFLILVILLVLILIL